MLSRRPHSLFENSDTSVGPAVCPQITERERPTEANLTIRAVGAFARTASPRRRLRPHGKSYLDCFAITWLENFL